MSYSLDNNYLDALRRRDVHAEEFLIAAFGRQLRMGLRRQFKCAEMIDDAMQETFLRVFLYFRAGKTLRAASSLPGFIKAVSVYVSMEMLRKKRCNLSYNSELHEPADGQADPECLAVFDEQRTRVVRALRRVDHKDADILRRIYLNEEDKDSVCRELDVSREYLRVLLHRAKLRLKAAMLSLDRRVSEEPRAAA